MTTRAGAWADESSVTFRVADPAHNLAGVRLHQEVRIPPDQLEFSWDTDCWQLRVDRPPVSRMEYLLEFRLGDGSTKTTLDPANPKIAPGAFGPKSVLEFPWYRPPGWLAAAAEPGRSEEFELAVPSLRGTIGVRAWSPARGADERLPLLVVHDGPEYDSLASLTQYLAAGVSGGWIPPLRAALLSPGDRNRWYSANSRYARALRHTVIPALTSRLGATVRVGMGTSLGGLAMLHTHARYPGAFDGLFLQSGSFFLPRFDSQESRFPYYQRIVSFTAEVHDGRLPTPAVPVALTCGAIEENAENNRLMARALADRGYPVTLHEVPDMHNYTAWRDSFDPSLARLLRRVCQ